MKILVCGDRNWDDSVLIRKVLTKYCRLYASVITLIHGDCRGADRLAGKIGEELGFIVIKVPAQWGRHGRSAGPIRNQKMLTMRPNLVIGFHQQIKNSKGTKHMMKISAAADIPTLLIERRD